ncbi:Rieske 2Fe-2S domain-containing protein [Pedobacter sp. SD-b]|uniref:Rieske 2Fe-2S domain-containing protein n=1 Tax=Pedobacter segetis TaxID=2793069 RepID=A0ABS1BGM3_9SPHI|nr:Rieske 2Fe-2S domain-containing protein [Pedobacter segetis]MBK0382021.1 Rieske 2Fe-2S domain-containing protein [Pedobacter segetis]
MKREEFIKSLGLGVAMVCTGACMSACGSKGDTGTPNPNPSPNPGGGGSNGNTVSVSISGKLANVGDQTRANGVLFFRIATGNTPSSFVATEALCPHQGGNLNWLNNQNKVQCDLHQSEYTSAGAVTQGPQNTAGSTRALKIYSTAITGDTITATVS